MATVIESLTTEEQREVDPHLFTCCPNCRHQFKIPPPTSVVRGFWNLHKDVTFYKDERVPITKTHSRLLYEIAKSHVPLRIVSLGYRICSNDAENVENIVAVHCHRIKKTLGSLDIPIPFSLTRSIGYKWVE